MELIKTTERPATGVKGCLCYGHDLNFRLKWYTKGNHPRLAGEAIIQSSGTKVLEALSLYHLNAYERPKEVKVTADHAIRLASLLGPAISFNFDLYDYEVDLTAHRDGMFFRVYNGSPEDGDFKDYKVDHVDCTMVIEDSSAALYDGPGNEDNWLDYTSQMMGSDQTMRRVKRQ